MIILSIGTALLIFILWCYLQTVEYWQNDQRLREIHHYTTQRHKARSKCN